MSRPRIFGSTMQSWLTLVRCAPESAGIRGPPPPTVVPADGHRGVFQLHQPDAKLVDGQLQIRGLSHRLAIHVRSAGNANWRRRTNQSSAPVLDLQRVRSHTLVFPPALRQSAAPMCTFPRTRWGRLCRPAQVGAGSCNAGSDRNPLPTGRCVFALSHRATPICSSIASEGTSSKSQATAPARFRPATLVGCISKFLECRGHVPS